MKHGVIPQRFKWNNWGNLAQKWPNVLEQKLTKLQWFWDQRWTACSLLRTRATRSFGCSSGENESWRLRSKLSVTHIHIYRFCLSDDYFRFYTRFSSERVFRIFWESLEPSASNLVYWSKAQRQGLEAVSGSNPKRKLQLTDEVFSLLLLCVCGSKREGLGRSL